MAKTLLLLRHAKSSWEDDLARDFDRPLNDRGRDAAPTVARYMAERGWRPDAVICSPARRTSQTLDFVLAQLGLGERAGDAPIVTYPERLYLADPPRLLAEIAGIDPRAGAALVVAHNPGIQDLAVALADPVRSDPDAMAAIDAKFPTAGLAVFTFSAKSWGEISPRTGALVDFVTPKSLLRPPQA